MNRLAFQQRDFNLQSQLGWNRFAEHRRQVMRLLLSTAPTSGGQLCVLGAGNCNDLDLTQLAAAYQAIHLVDLDSQAMDAGVNRQQVIGRDRIWLHGNCDLSGILPRLSGWEPTTPPDEADIDEAIAAASIQPPPNCGPCTTVASVCLLSQLIHSIVVTLGAQHPRFLELLRAVRLRHLQMLAELTAPGGHALLITDVVSSDTCPSLSTIHEDRLQEYVRQLLESRNYFHGLSPAMLAQVLHSESQLAQRICDLRFVLPWRWDLGPRVYAVYALTFSVR